MKKMNGKGKMGGLNFKKGVVKVRNAIRNKRGDILNRLLLSLGIGIVVLTLAIGIKALFFRAALPPQEIVKIEQPVREKPFELAKEEPQAAREEKEIVQIMPQAARSEVPAKRVAREKSDFIKHLEERGIEVKQVEPLEGLNRLVAKDPAIADAALDPEDAEDLAREEKRPLSYVPGQVLVIQTLPDGTKEFSKLEVTPGEEAKTIKELSLLSDVQTELNEKFPIFLLGRPDPHLGKQWALDILEVPDAWDMLEEYYAGRAYPEIKIAIIDTGADLNHPDLKDNIDMANSKNFVNPRTPPQDDNENSHGTHIAGIIGAVINNNIGVAGIVPKPKLIIIKALDAEGRMVDAVTLANALTYAVEQNPRIINMSWGGWENFLRNRTLRTAFRTAFRSEALLIAAAGNHGVPGYQGEPFLLYPARYRRVLGVGGTDANDGRWETATVDYTGSSDPAKPNYNPWHGEPYESAHGARVKVSAPAGDVLEDIYSTLRNSGYGYAAGTSMASAYVSGVAGLILTAKPELTKAELMEQIISTADEIDTDKPIGPRVNAASAIEDLISIIDDDTILITGTVKDSAGNPLAGVKVRAKCVDFIEDILSEATGADGKYLIEITEDDVKDAEDFFDIVLSVDGRSEYTPQTIADAFFGEAYTKDFTPRVTPPTVIPAPPIPTPGPVPSPTGPDSTPTPVPEDQIWIYGKVTEGGNPTEGARVELRLKDKSGENVQTKEKITGSDGTYEIKFTGLDTTKKYDLYELAPRTQHGTMTIMTNRPLGTRARVRTDLSPGTRVKYDIELGGGGGGDSGGGREHDWWRPLAYSRWYHCEFMPDAAACGAAKNRLSEALLEAGAQRTQVEDVYQEMKRKLNPGDCYFNPNAPACIALAESRTTRTTPTTPTPAPPGETAFDKCMRVIGDAAVCAGL